MGTWGPEEEVGHECMFVSRESLSLPTEHQRFALPRWSMLSCLSEYFSLRGCAKTNRIIEQCRMNLFRSLENFDHARPVAMSSHLSFRVLDVPLASLPQTPQGTSSQKVLVYVELRKYLLIILKRNSSHRISLRYAPVHLHKSNSQFINFLLALTMFSRLRSSWVLELKQPLALSS